MDLIVREAGMEDLRGIKKLVEDVFNEKVAPLYSKEGIRTFRGHIELKKMEERMKRNYRALVAKNRDLEPIGTIFIKNRNHINLFFVRTDLERKGIGRCLLEEAVKIIIEVDPEVERITVNSSPNAVDAYGHLGFIATEKEKVLHGIRFIPMVLELSQMNRY
jgi:predicted GNAT family N-acyltransferase